MNCCHSLDLPATYLLLKGLELFLQHLMDLALGCTTNASDASLLQLFQLVLELVQLLQCLLRVRRLLQNGLCLGSITRCLSVNTGHFTNRRTRLVSHVRLQLLDLLQLKGSQLLFADAVLSCKWTSQMLRYNTSHL